MARIKLTKRAVDALGTVNSPTYFFDVDLPGFFLRVMPSGARAWGYEYRAGTGRTAPKRRVTIAQFGKLAPEQARSQAKLLAAHVAQGGDPASEKVEKARELTVQALVTFYAEEGCFVQRGLRQGEPMKAQTRAYTLARLRHHVVPLLGRKRVSEVGPADIERFVRDVSIGKTAKDEWAGPRARIIVRGGEGAARKVVRDLSAVFSFAVRRGIMASNPCERAAVRKVDNKRERFLSFEELQRLGTALTMLEGEGANPKAIAIIRLWALTGCRRDEIASLTWSEIDFERGLLILSDSKTGKSIRPLGAPALSLLSKFPCCDASGFVFPAERGGSFYAGTKRVWDEAIKRARLPGVTPHVLRHTLGSAASSAGEALALTGAILGHVNPRSTAIYAHIATDPAKRAADRVAGAIANALRGDFEKSVIDG